MVAVLYGKTVEVQNELLATDEEHLHAHLHLLTRHLRVAVLDVPSTPLLVLPGADHGGDWQRRGVFEAGLGEQPRPMRLAVQQAVR